MSQQPWKKNGRFFSLLFYAKNVSGFPFVVLQHRLDYGACPSTVRYAILFTCLHTRFRTAKQLLPLPLMDSRLSPTQCRSSWIMAKSIRETFGFPIKLIFSPQKALSMDRICAFRERKIPILPSPYLCISEKSLLGQTIHGPFSLKHIKDEMYSQNSQRYPSEDSVHISCKRANSGYNVSTGFGEFLSDCAMLLLEIMLLSF